MLVHGYPDAASVWEKTAQILAQRYYVIAYDVRGAGRSDAPDHTRAFGLEHLVEDLAQVVDATSPDAPVHLVCHDWGSIQSWEAVTTERMAGRIASYTSISGPSIDHAAYWMMSRLRSGSAREMAAVARQLSHSWYIGAFQLPLFGPAIWKLGMDRLWPSLLSRLEGIDVQTSPTQTRDGSLGVNLYRANFSQRLRDLARQVQGGDPARRHAIHTNALLERLRSLRKHERLLQQAERIRWFNGLVNVVTEALTPVSRAAHQGRELGAEPVAGRGVREPPR